jgi:Alw26I/Eco31I/Esp3I family type II restriction m6 adenine DNA methyltransferase
MAAKTSRRKIATNSHVAQLQRQGEKGTVVNGKSLLDRIEGRFYTHELIGRHLVHAVVEALDLRGIPKARIVEPFCGDGRLICWLLEELVAKQKIARGQHLEIHLWDSDASALEVAIERVTASAKALQLKVEVVSEHGDAFDFAQSELESFHICLTNPPWENLKPDSRELKDLGDKEKLNYVEILRDRDKWLAESYPLSRPKSKFSGWGTNLARCGLEVAFKLTSVHGICAVVSPASVLADQVSEKLRQWLFTQNSVLDIAYYAAEARLFEKVDQPAITLVGMRGTNTKLQIPTITTYDRFHESKAIVLTNDDWTCITKDAFVIPIQFGLSTVTLRAKLTQFPEFGHLEGSGSESLWAGRELDETGHKEYLASTGRYFFVKGRMIQRYKIAEPPTSRVAKNGPPIPTSADHHRIVWRDVSRPTQKRRIQATIIPPGWVTGNSLHVAYFRDGDLDRLHALLGIMNSFVFEWMTRSQLATGHVSLGVVRRVPIPEIHTQKRKEILAQLSRKIIEGDDEASRRIEIIVAKSYGLSHKEFSNILDCFDKVTVQEKECLLVHEEWKKEQEVENPSPLLAVAVESVAIPNHYASNLSKMDMDIIKSVPPGGNWKNIPASVPSQRIKQIRESFARGEGSRSTYYGRLQSNAPSYTINTYFPRPGNGCHIHYDQDRTLSQREAARLQSFPDSFSFEGTKTKINTQIGNAVPPLLAFQIASSLPLKGMYIDLFSGAGGLSLGFKWAGWKPIAANDIDSSFLATYRANIHYQTVPGDIRDESVFRELVKLCKEAKKRDPDTPLFVLGGPPCQGFSTAGNKRSMNDDRNWLFQSYKLLLEKVRPAGFIFENVSGLLNIDRGRVYDMILKELSKTVVNIHSWKLNTEHYAIPQRRTRVILVGSKDPKLRISRPDVLTETKQPNSLFTSLPPMITVEEAIGDLPALAPGEDGSRLPYRHAPASAYQKLMRGCISPNEYLLTFRREMNESR